MRELLLAIVVVLLALCILTSTVSRLSPLSPRDDSFPVSSRATPSTVDDAASPPSTSRIAAAAKHNINQRPAQQYHSDRRQQQFVSFIDDAQMVDLLRSRIHKSPDDAREAAQSARRTERVFPLPWHWNATACLAASRLHIDEFDTRLGVLKELESLVSGHIVVPHVRNAKLDAACKIRNRAKCRPENYYPRRPPIEGLHRSGCVIASRGRWLVPFAADAFTNLAAAAFPRLAGKLTDLAQQGTAAASAAAPNNRNNNNNNNNNKPRSVRPTTSSRLEDLVARICARGENESWRFNLTQTAMTLLIALSRLPPVSAPVYDASGTASTQSFVRLYLVGNSFVRALLAKIVALMRGMPQHYDRGTHTTVRYVFTTHGDYYLNARHLAPLDAQIPIRLEYAAAEKVFFEVVYEYVHGDKACPPGKPPHLPLHCITPPAGRNGTNAVMSAVLTRSLPLTDVTVYDRAVIGACTRQFIGRLHASVVPRGLLVQQQSPAIQVQVQHVKTIFFVEYERRYLDFTRFARNGTNRGVVEVMTVPPVWDCQLTDARAHSQCIALPHFPEEADHFNFPALAYNCEDRLSSQGLWIFSVAAILRQ